MKGKGLARFFQVNKPRFASLATSLFSKVVKGKEEEKQKKIEEEKQLALKQKAEEEERIREENKRIREWEDKFDQEQKMKEEELIKKFYNDNPADQNNDVDNNEKNKNN